MIILPAIDLVGGRCVRLEQGDFARETRYEAAPAEALAAFAEAGAIEAHLVDLDGARQGAARQHDLFAALAADSPLQLQVAGGFRHADEVARMLDAGVARVVIGSLALKDPPAFRGMMERFGAERLTLALDIKEREGALMVATHGWAEDSGRTLHDVLSDFPGVAHLLVTDISRDGMLSGANEALIAALVARYPAMAVQASGGVGTLDDVAALKALGAPRAIIGKALWEGRFTLEEALRHARR